MLLNLMGKDLKRALRDRKALLILLLMPAVLITILGFSVGRFLDGEGILYAEEIKENMKSFDFQKILLEDILDSEELSKFLSYKILAEKEALDLLEKEKLSAVIIIPEDFTYYTMMNLTSPFVYRQEIQVIKSQNNTFAGRIVEEIMKGFTNALSTGIIAKSSLFEMGIELGIGDKVQGEIGGIHV